MKEIATKLHDYSLFTRMREESEVGKRDDCGEGKGKGKGGRALLAGLGKGAT